MGEQGFTQNAILLAASRRRKDQMQRFHTKSRRREGWKPLVDKGFGRQGLETRMDRA